MPFHLAISASANGELHRLKAPLLLVPHGAGHNRLLRTAEGHRGEVSGLARRQLMHDGRIVPTAIALSHQEQLARLQRDCPEAATHATVVGDLVFDRILANLVRRDRFRRALKVSRDRMLVVVSSHGANTPCSAPTPELPARLVTELPADEYQVVLAAHPNAWYGHGGLQLRLWLAGARDGGLSLLPPRQGRQAALVAPGGTRRGRHSPRSLRRAAAPRDSHRAARR
jgi:hypothetical protein